MAQKQQQLQQQLRDVGQKLGAAPPSKDTLVKLLKQLANYLSELDQAPSSAMLEAMKPSLESVAKAELLKHQDKDVKVLVATCICEITRITAPEPPYSDEVLRDIFHLFVWTFSGLSDINSPLFGRRVVILETLARYKSCVIMLDLECGDLITEMFSTFLTVVSDNHPENVRLSMRTIMTLILEESEDVDEKMLFIILSSLGRKKGDGSPAARNLAKKVIEHCKDKLEMPVKQFLLSSFSGDSSASNNLLDYHEVIYDIYQCAPQILLGVIPYITGELLTDKLDIRLKTVNLLGDLFALPGNHISEPFKLLFSEFLKRLTDRVVEVRLSLVEHAKNCLVSNSSRVQTPDIISALSDRLLDYDENVRKKVVAAIYDVACHKLDLVPSATTKIAAERLRDKSVSVKQYTMERLAELYRSYCQDSSGLLSPLDFEWIPGKILRCLYDRDFRSDTVEDILCNLLFPAVFSVKDKVRHWIEFFSLFDKVEVKALEQMFIQKQRLQMELQRYLSIKQSHQENDGTEHQKKLSSCFRVMARFFSDSVKAEENFQLFNQLKDANIWRNLSYLLDPSATFHQSWACRNDLLQMLGEKHPLHDFTSSLTIKISFLFVNKETIKGILEEVTASVSDGNNKLSTCMNLLAVHACSFPQLFSDYEEILVSLLKEDNEVIREGIAHVLAKGGGVLREKLATVSSSVGLLLERLCLEGTRKQAKYAVQALAAITKDDGLKSLSVLYKRLVDMLEEKIHLPSILQSLGAIAQHAMPIFETRESEIVDFVTRKILKCSSKEDISQQKKEWNYQSELCKLKVFGLKALVKSFMPVKDAHLRIGIEKLLEDLKNVLIYGEISKDIESSHVDKAHMRLAAAKAVIRLSRQWEHKIPIDVIYTTFRISQDTYLEARSLFKSKIHQYIKERSLDAKFACVFLFNIVESQPPEIAEDKHHLIEIVQLHYQLRSRQISTQSDQNPLLVYPEYILPWCIHAFAHHESFPNIDNSEDVQAFVPIYRRLHMLLSALFYGDESSHSDVYSSTIKERFAVVASILQSIKFSEDSNDKTKTKNSQALCDLGLSIAMQLVHEKEDLAQMKFTAPLPVEIYKHEIEDGDGSQVHVERSWLGGDTALTYFESVKSNGNVEEDSNEPFQLDVDFDTQNLPLGVIMKSLKLQASRRRKALKKQSCHLEVRKNENEVDVLRVVREINMGSQEGESMKENEPSTSELRSSPNTKKNNKDLPSKEKMNRTANLVPSSIPKRRRSSFGSSPKSAKVQKKSEQSLQPLGLEDSTAEDKTASDSELLVSCMSVAKSVISGGKRIGSNQNINGKACDIEAENNSKNAIMPEKSKSKVNTLPTGQNRKRKRKSIARLEKCSQKIVEDSSGLVGCRIKVWWPLDKRYYDGKVQSYDQIKKKHVILYDDGDTEFLFLNKERWELIGSDDRPIKRSNARNTFSEEDCLSDENGKASRSGSKRKAIKNIHRKTTAAKAIHDKSKKIEEKFDKSFGVGPTDVSNCEPSVNLQNNDHQSDSEESTRSPKEEDAAENANAEMIEKPSEAADENSSDANDEQSSNSDDEPLNAWKQRVGK